MSTPSVADRGPAHRGDGVGALRSWTHPRHQRPAVRPIPALRVRPLPLGWRSIIVLFARGAGERPVACPRPCRSLGLVSSSEVGPARRLHRRAGRRRRWDHRIPRSHLPRPGARRSTLGRALGRRGGCAFALAPPSFRDRKAPSPRSSPLPILTVWCRSPDRPRTWSACHPPYVKLPSWCRERCGRSRRFGIWRRGWSGCRAQPRPGRRRYGPAPVAGVRLTDRRRAPAALRRARKPCSWAATRPRPSGSPGAGGAGATPLVPRRAARGPIGPASDGQTCSKDSSEPAFTRGTVPERQRQARPVCLALGIWA